MAGALHGVHFYESLGSNEAYKWTIFGLREQFMHVYIYGIGSKYLSIIEDGFYTHSCIHQLANIPTRSITIRIFPLLLLLLLSSSSRSINKSI